MKKEIEFVKLVNDEKNKEIERKNAKIEALSFDLQKAREKAFYYQESFKQIVNSSCWKITKPIRIIKDHSNQVISNIYIYIYI